MTPFQSHLQEGGHSDDNRKEHRDEIRSLLSSLLPLLPTWDGELLYRISSAVLYSFVNSL
jgi:hypothetical protein